MTYRGSSEGHAWENQFPYLSYVAASHSRSHLNWVSGPRDSLATASPSSTTATRTLVIAGSGARRAALERLLRGAAIQVVGVLPGTAGASAYIEHWQPDAVLIDLDLSRQSAASLMALVSGSFSGLAVVVLADHLEATVIARMLRSGIASVLQRCSSQDQIGAAIEAAAEELVVLGADVAQVMVARNSAARTKGLRDDADDGSEDIEPLIEHLTPQAPPHRRIPAPAPANPTL